MRLTLRPQAGRLIGWALGYAERGWPVFPVAPHGKNPLNPNGLLKASTEVERITAWWTRWPEANIGLRTGVAFDVLDIDGDAGWASLHEKAGPEEQHSGPVSRTSRGEHWLFAPTGTANQQKMLAGMDWRGTNGYIVAPPSVHESGIAYRWLTDHTIAIPEPPDWLTPFLTHWEDKEAPTIKVMQTQPYQSKNPQRNLAYGNVHLTALLTDIVQMAEQLGYAPRPDGGGRYRIHCPFHEGDREPSLKLYPADNSFYCYGCGAWGDALNLRDLRPGGKRADR